ncbi:MAG: glucose-6-phosphate dehydrogenase [Deltaproteobacteria bacterium]|nr:glucose-6-phosphate dehydrogenase [Deltaproteobacteria bacterium]
MNFQEEKGKDPVAISTVPTNTDEPLGKGQDSLTAGVLDPCIFIILGASGDLTSRKLIPALYSLFLNKALPHPFLIVGCSRTVMSDEGFRERMKEALEKAGPLDPSTWPAFARLLHYRTILYDDFPSFKRLADSLKELDKKYKTGGNRIFELAIPPSLYETAARSLGRAGLGIEYENGRGWARIVVEKPFGRDLETALALDKRLHEYFQENQIFRIDHYLAKETVQNILVCRFANSIFEPLWNRNYIDQVSITAAETLGVEHRAGYYEQAGVLRDMFQNHLMQLLALTTMESPTCLDADPVQDEKVKVFRSLRPFPAEDFMDYTVLGQYGRGRIDGKEVPAYREEPGVSPDSLTPTFAMIKVFIDNWRWQGVPFYLTSGKRLARKQTAIVIQFKEIPHSVFRETLEEGISPNRLILGIYPEEKITLTFQTKRPGAHLALLSVNMNFFYYQNYQGHLLEAYEKILLDCLQGDRLLFWRQDGIEACWAFLTPILWICEHCDNRAEMLRFYASGSWGPEALKKLPELID